MPQFESFEVLGDELGFVGNVNFEARSPAGATEPARWASNNLVSGWQNRLGDARLSFRIKRNSADTADQVQVSMVIPKQCDAQGACSTTIVDKSVVNFYMVIPDSLSLADREKLVKTVSGLLMYNDFRTAIINGSNFY